MTDPRVSDQSLPLAEDVIIIPSIKRGIGNLQVGLEPVAAKEQYCLHCDQSVGSDCPWADECGDPPHACVLEGAVCRLCHKGVTSYVYDESGVYCTACWFTKSETDLSRFKALFDSVGLKYEIDSSVYELDVPKTTLEIHVPDEDAITYFFFDSTGKFAGHRVWG